MTENERRIQLLDENARLQLELTVLREQRQTLTEIDRLRAANANLRKQINSLVAELAVAE